MDKGTLSFWTLVFICLCASYTQEAFNIRAYSVDGLSMYLFIFLIFWIASVIIILEKIVDIAKGKLKVQQDSLFLVLWFICFIATSIFLFGLYNMSNSSYTSLRYSAEIYSHHESQSFFSFFTMIVNHSFGFVFGVIWENLIVKISAGLFVASLIFMYIARIIKFTLKDLFPNKY